MDKSDNKSCKNMKKIIWAIIACQLFFSGISIAGAEDNSVQSEYFQAEIKSMISEKELASGGTEYEFKAEVLTGDMEGEEIIITSTQTGAYSSNDYKAGEKVLIASYTSMEGENVFYISDYVRDTDIYILSAVFVLIICLIGRWKGIRAILSLVLSFFIILNFLIPKILTGADPVLWTIIYGSILTAGSTYLVYGINKKSTIALAGMLFGITAVGMLSVMFSGLTHLAGFTQEEVIYLIDQMGIAISLKGIMLAGFIIGGLGVLDDVTIGQVSAVIEIKKANPKLHGYELYKRAMVVGVDHIAAMVNTLFLAYAGTAFPLLLTLYISGNNVDLFRNAINNEMIATEIVRTLVGSIGLALALPVTTFFATYFFRKEAK